MEKCEMEGMVDEGECFREKGESLKGQRKKENGKMRERERGVPGYIQCRGNRLPRAQIL